MKKLLFFTAVLALALAAFAACEAVAPVNAEQPGGESPGVSNGTGANDDDMIEPRPIDFSLEVRGQMIFMDMDINAVVERVGEPQNIFTAPSCAFDGYDRIFQFAGMQIHTYPDGDMDRVHTINIRDDSIRTNGGILLGSSYADVVAAYGGGYSREFDMLTFTRGQTTLSFFMDGDMVISILFELIFD